MNLEGGRSQKAFRWTTFLEVGNPFRARRSAPLHHTLQGMVLIETSHSKAISDKGLEERTGYEYADMVDRTGDWKLEISVGFVDLGEVGL